jgi:hypothetical protein
MFDDDGDGLKEQRTLSALWNFRNTVPRVEATLG